MATATYNEKDQNWQEESTTYWFTLNGTDYGTEYSFDNDVYGIAEHSDGSTVVLDCDGRGMTDGDNITIAVVNTVTVTDEMRQD